MSGNIHARAALNDGNNLSEQQIEAVLALAYEARTANLIALYTHPAVTMKAMSGNEVTWSAGEKTVGALLETILTRLDVQPDGTVKP